MKQFQQQAFWFSIRRLLSLFVIACVLSACAMSGNQSNTSNTKSKSNTPGATTIRTTSTPTSSHPVAGQPTGTGKLPTGKPLPQDEVKPLTFNLAYNDSAMQQDVAQMYTQGSASFHRFLTPNQIAQRYALSDAQQQQVITWLTQNGYTVDATDTLHSTLDVHATVATIERTLHITLSSFTIDNHTFFMQQGNPTLPSSVSSLVASVVGLDNFALPQFKPPLPGLLTTAQSATLAGNCANYGTNSTLTRNQLAGAYQFSQLYQQGYQGQGMTIGVAEFGDAYDPHDIANYAACTGIAAPNIQNIDVVGHLASGSGEGEAAMDLELIAGLAPQATILDYQADTTNTSFAQAMVDVFDRVATDHQVQVLSVSYGTYESSFSTSELAAINRSLLTLAEEGISVFISSGDCGAFAERIHNVAQVSFPSSAPYAIAVGGTHLEVNTSNVRTGETAWGQDDGLPSCSNDWGSGGGVSQNSAFKKPTWQVGVGTTTQYSGAPFVTTEPGPLSSPVLAPNGLRQVPDVAAAAYPNLSIYYKGSWVASGGTSAAAPIWAAGTLLVDQGLQQKSKAPIGGVPEFYTLANHSGSYHPYNDITSGGNLFYNATPGWDYVTGWGSPNFNDILQLETSLQS